MPILRRSSPLQVLRRFLSVLGSFDWEHFCLALQGPLPLAELHTNPHGERATLLRRPTHKVPLFEQGNVAAGSPDPSTISCAQPPAMPARPVPCSGDGPHASWLFAAAG